MHDHNDDMRPEPAVSGRRHWQHHPDFDDPTDDRPGRHHGGGGGGGRGRRTRAGWRAQRGDVRAAVLTLLAEEPMHGYQLIQSISERTDGAWSPSPGAIYPTLSLLEDEGLISTTSSGGRNLATLSAPGRELVERGDLADPFAAFADGPGPGGSLIGGLTELRDPLRQISRSGSARQVQAATEALSKTRRDLYLILAGDPTEG